jgi:hypothetical protein
MAGEDQKFIEILLKKFIQKWGNSATTWILG